ncbi:hypothetical protein GL264_07965 [Aeromonas jandaei]|uniref:hypothetical protein n=1 Tax=Aeromonas jandaei TaxID=650 RepID=UPI001C5AA337|nr:hypothetical protein [Aeromonas jandaei]MBW3760741.1 hypothetical protein [Aeromonas jandaei]
MPKYKPNHIPLGVRIICAFLIVFFVIYGVAELANGYTYVPAKRGGFFISGIPTLIIAISSFLFSIVAALKIIDHYDKRDNEKVYLKVQSIIFKVALYMLLGAPCIDILNVVLMDNGIDVFPKLHGFAETFSYHTPGMRAFLIYVTPFSDNALYIVGGACGLVLISETLEGYHGGKYKSLCAVLNFIAMIGFGVFILSLSFKELLLGEAGFGKEHAYAVTAMDEPAKFNAVLLTGFMVGGMFFFSGCIALIDSAIKKLRKSRCYKTQSNDILFK